MIQSLTYQLLGLFICTITDGRLSDSLSMENLIRCYWETSL